MTSSDPLVSALRSTPRHLGDLVQTLPDSQQRQPPREGGFAIVEHVCHLRDYEEACLGRLLRMLVEECPALEDFDGGRVAAARNYSGQNPAAALADFAAHRRATLKVLTALSDEQLQRGARLGQTERISIRQLAEGVAAHDREHVQQVERLLDDLRASDKAETSAIRRMTDEFTEGFNGGDVGRVMRLYGNRYVDVNLRVPEQSHEERRAYYASLVRRGAFRVDVCPDEILVYGSIAIGRGRIILAGRDGAATTELRYLEVLRKEADGWKAMWGIDGPVQEYDG